MNALHLYQHQGLLLVRTPWNEAYEAIALAPCRAFDLATVGVRPESSRDRFVPVGEPPGMELPADRRSRERFNVWAYAVALGGRPHVLTAWWSPILTDDDRLAIAQHNLLTVDPIAIAVNACEQLHQDYPDIPIADLPAQLNVAPSRAELLRFAVPSPELAIAAIAS